MLQNVINLIGAVGQIVSALLPIIIGVTVLIFFWGLIKYVREPGKEHEEGKAIMIAGIIAIFIEVSLWGIIAFLGSAIGIGSNQANQGQISAPQIPRSGAQ